MGAFDFTKDAGEAPEAAPDLAPVLQRSIELLEIPVEDLKLSVNGDVVSVSGVCPSQADKERLVLVLGNTQGIAKVDDHLRVEKPEPEATFYTVVSGDSLSKIAKAHYGDAMKYPVIFEANKPMLKDPDKIYPGQVLRIPPQ